MYFPFRTLLLAFVLLALPALGDGADVSIHLAVEPNHVICGIRPSLLISAQNDSASDVELPAKVLLLVTPSSGSSFVAQFSGSQETPYSRAELPGERTIKAHGQAQFAYVARSLDGPPGWFDDHRLAGAGTYRLQLILADRVIDSKVQPTPAYKIDTAVSVRYRSTEAVLTVETPRGDDAVLWHHLLNIAHNHGSANWSSRMRTGSEWLQFMKEAVEKYPSSAYSPYVVRAYSETAGGERLTPEDRMANAERVLDAQPSASNRDDIHLFIAEMEVRSAERAASGPKPDMDRAVAIYDRARAHFEEVERMTNDPEIRQRSRQEREGLPSRDDLRQEKQG